MAGNSETIPLTLTAELGQLREQLKTIPGITGEQAKLMVAELNRQFKRAEQGAKKAGKEASQGWDGLKDKADAAGGAAEKLRGVLSNISPTAAEAAGLVNDLGDAVTVLASPAGVAAGTLGALALATSLAAASLVKAVFASDEALASLEGFKKLGSSFYPAVPASTLASIEAVNAASDALLSIWNSLVVTLGANVAPELERLTNIAVGLALEAADLFAAWAQGRNLLEAFATFVSRKLIAALLTPLRPLELLAESIQQAAKVAGIELPDSADRALNRLKGLADEAAAGAAAFVVESIAGSDLAETFAHAETRGAAFVALQQRATKAAQAGTKAFTAYKESIAGMDEDLAAARQVEDVLAELSAAQQAATTASLEGIDLLQAKRADELLALQASYQAGVSLAAGRDDQLLALAAQYEAARAAIIEQSEAEIRAIQEKARAEQAAGWKGFALSLGDTVASGLVGTLANVADIVGQTNEAAALKLFRISKAAAIVQATISAYQAAAAAAASAAALGPVAAVAAGLITFAAVEAVSVSQIAAQSPPSFGDTPGVQHMDGGGLVRFAEGDYFAAAKDPQALAAQVAAFTAGGPADSLLGMPPAAFALPPPFGGLPLALAAPAFEDTPRVQRMGGGGGASAPRRRAEGSSRMVLVQQRGTVVDERVTRFQKGQPSELSRGLDHARGGTNVGKTRRTR